MKKILLILFALFTCVTYSQSTVDTDMQKNIDYNLNSEGTILYINSDSSVRGIEVIHRLTSKITIFDIRGKSVKLELNKLSNGRNIIMVYNRDGIINLISVDVVHDGKVDKSLVIYKYVESTNTAFGSNKRTGFGAMKYIIKKINKNKFDLKTFNGSKNTLTVHAIYSDGSIELIYNTSKHGTDNIK